MRASRRRVPGLRIRLVAGFAAVMLVVLAGAGAFVFWRVRYALDLRLDEDLAAQVSDLSSAVAAHPGDPGAAMRAVPAGDRLDLLLAVDGSVLAASPDPAAVPPPAAPPAAVLERATREPVHYGRGTLWSARGEHLRMVAFPLAGGPARVGVSAVRLDQRDEALRELLLQLALANLLALGVASLVGYRLAHAALAPVERYRAQAEQITAGATGVRLDVPEDADDEVTRLGRTLNT
ncbi:MAG TPA: hypothetical protein VNC22_07730, partial [Sporichthya sp.]|nr:hypothetical protein [Sporichthya sp.]